jgi:hypothetical protein
LQIRNGDFVRKVMEKKILLYEHEGFIEEIFKQINQDFILNPDLKNTICTDAILLINDPNFKDPAINILAYIFPVIVIGTTTLPSLNPYIKIISKPILLPEFLAILNKVKNYAILIAPNIWLNTNQHFLIKNTKSLSPVSLTSTETKLLHYLAIEENLKTKNDILKNVFGYKSQDTNTLETHLSRLRKKIEPELTITNDGIGQYIFYTPKVY